MYTCHGCLTEYEEYIENDFTMITQEGCLCIVLNAKIGG